MTFLFDNNFSYKLAAMLRALDVDAIALREAFDQDIDDVDLFRELRGEGIILVTSDMRIQRRPVEIQALKECGISAIFLRPFWHKRGKWEQANWLTRHWQAIEGHVADWDAPVYLEVEVNGKINHRHF